MLEKEHIRLIRETITHHEPPVLSVYVDVNPAKPENARKGWLIRAKNSLKSIELSRDLYERVVTLLGEERPQARTVALFAAEDLLERYDLQVELPIVDLAHGRVEVRWGDPHVTPLLYALDEFERAGVLVIEKMNWRFYEIYLGEVEELTETFGSISQEEWEKLRNYLPTLYKNLFSGRVATHPDRFPRRVEAWVNRFLKHVARLVEEMVVDRDIGRIVLLGPEEQTRFFEHFLSRGIRRRIVARVGNLPSPNPSSNQVFEKVAPYLEAAERAQEQALLDEIHNRMGIWGLDPTLEALQVGRLAVLVAPWNLDAVVWKCPKGWVAGTREAAQVFCPDQELKQVALRDIVAEIAADFGARLEFVRGDAEERLLKQFGGLAGLRRW